MAAFVTPNYSSAYTIDYNLNGGSGSFSTHTVSYGSSFTISSNKPTMSGETFKFWYLRRNKDGKYYVGGSNGWLTWDEMGKKNLKPASYSPGQSLTLGESWIKDGGDGSSFTFVARWTPVGTKTIADGKYYITTKLSGNSCLTVHNESTSDGANVELGSAVGNTKQLWIVKYLNDGYYSIQNANSGKTLDVDNGGIYSGTNVQQWAGVSDNQKWVISQNSDGTYCIRAKCNGLYLDLAGAKTTDGTNIQVYAKASVDNQKWNFVEDSPYKIEYDLNGGSGNFASQSVNYGSSFTTHSNEPTKNGEVFKCWYLKRQKDQKYYVGGSNGWWRTWDDIVENKVQPAMYRPEQSLVLGESWIHDGGTGSDFSFEAQWTPIGTKTLADGKYYITTKLNEDSCLSVQNESTTDGANVQLNSSVGNEKQSWIVKYLDDGYYSIQNANSGKTLDVYKGEIFPGTNVQQNSGISENQKWVISQNNDGTYSIRAKCNGLYLDVDGSNTSDGTNIQVCKGTSGDNQKWVFKEYTLPCSHESTEIRNAKTATCTEAGYTGDTYCRTCGEKLNSGDIIPALEHNWDNGVVTSEATYTSEGERTYTCTRCGVTRTEIIPVQGCNHSDTEIRDAKSATCTEAGYTGDTYCKDCGAKIKTGSNTAALGHSWDNGVVTKEATYTTAGVKTYTCSRCGVTRTETIPAKVCSHSKTETRNAVTVTCDRPGYSGDVFCSDCGILLSGGNSTPALGHSWNSGEVTREATYTTEGVLTYTCTRCNETRTEIIPVKVCRHNNTEKRNIVEVTCARPGYSGDEFCKDCGVLLSSGTSSPALGHNWNSGEVTKEATYDAEGVLTYTCKRCGETRTEIIPAIVCIHNNTETRNEVAATCTHPGYSGDEFCKDCGILLGSGNTIQALGHSWDNGEVTTEPTGENKGIMTYTCTRCGETRTEEIDKTKPEEKPEKPADSVYEGSSLEDVEEVLTHRTSDKDPAGTTYGKLTAKISKPGKKSQKITWKKVKGAKQYIIYGNKCGTKNKLRRIGTTTSSSYMHDGLKKGIYYKYIVVAVDGNNKVVASSKMVHSATTGGKAGNCKKLTTNAKKNKVSVKKGKTFKLKVKTLAASKKMKIRKHRGTSYESSNTNIATVSSKGVIKGKKKGKCTVYAYAQNGICAKISVTVK